MAAGRGERLRPFTDVVPKPALPVANEPVMGYALRLLAAHGIRDVVANAWWKADILQRVFGDGSAYGVNLVWSMEDEPLGTAGGVKHAEAHLRDGAEPVLILSGDGLHAADLSALIRAHRESGALVTLGLIEVTEPSEYGVTVLDGAGWVTAFQEKPAPGTELSRLANTGIYVLDPSIFDRLPTDGEFYDFGSQLFPELMGVEKAMYGFQLDTYWNDIGGAEAWVDATLALVQGRIQLPGLEQPEDGKLIHPTARVSPDAHIVGPCVIGASCTVEAGASVVRAVVMPGTTMQSGDVAAGGLVGSLAGLDSWAQSISLVPETV